MHSLIKTIIVLNVDKEESTLSADKIATSNVNDQSFIVSDADEELLILVEFNEIICLKSIKIYALPHDNTDSSPPKKVNVYKLDNLNKDFSDFNNKAPNISIQCINKRLTKGQKINLNNIFKFKKTKYMAIYIKSNQNDTETTFLSGITFQTATKSVGDLH
eukprot:92127_1